MTYFLIMLAGLLYGFIFGLIPVAGATTALITVYSFVGLFYGDPYALVVFTTAIVVSSSIGDSFASVVLNIPGAGGAAATMVDGFPMAQRGEAARALSASIATSWINGLIWGAVVFFFLPFYTKVVLYFGIKEMFAFLLFALTSVTFISSKYYVRGFIALALGIFVGLIGMDPVTAAFRFTGGIEYLGAGVQMIPVMAGVLAFPELISAFRKKAEAIKLDDKKIKSQLWQGVKDSWKYKWDGLRGGLVGGFVGLVPGIGGAIADWFAYSQTVAFASKRGEKLGNGNVRGVVGCEGANNAQKATSYVPTVLFGIPGAPFEVIVMGLLMYVGLELGTVAVLTDTMFFSVLLTSYFQALIIILPVSYLFIRYAVKITNLPFQYYFWPILATLIWASVQYTGMYMDYVMFGVCCLAGMAMKKLKLSRINFLIGFILSARLEATWVQFSGLYSVSALFTSWLPLTFIILAVVACVWGIFYNKARMDFV